MSLSVELSQFIDELNKATDGDLIASDSSYGKTYSNPDDVDYDQYVGVKYITWSSRIENEEVMHYFVLQFKDRFVEISGWHNSWDTMEYEFARFVKPVERTSIVWEDENGNT